MCGFIAQLVEHCTGIHRGQRLESRWSPDFLRLLPSNSLNWKIYCDDHSSLSSTAAVHIWIHFSIQKSLIRLYCRLPQISSLRDNPCLTCGTMETCEGRAPVCSYIIYGYVKGIWLTSPTTHAHAYEIKSMWFCGKYRKSSTLVSFQPTKTELDWDHLQALGKQ